MVLAIYSNLHFLCCAGVLLAYPEGLQALSSFSSTVSVQEVRGPEEMPSYSTFPQRWRSKPPPINPGCGWPAAEGMGTKRKKLIGSKERTGEIKLNFMNTNFHRLKQPRGPKVCTQGFPTPRHPWLTSWPRSKEHTLTGGNRIRAAQGCILIPA